MKTVIKPYFLKKQNYVLFILKFFSAEQLLVPCSAQKNLKLNIAEFWFLNKYGFSIENKKKECSLQKWFHPAVMLDQQDLMEWFSRFYCFATRLGNDLKLPFFMARAYRFCLTAALLWSKSTSQFECSHMV